jgi:hypothetical protein
LESVAGVHRWAFQNSTVGRQLARMTIDPVIFLCNLALPALALAAAGWIGQTSKMRYWRGCLAALLFFWWFGSVSLTAYSPLPLYARFAVPLLPLVSILGGTFLAELRVPRRSDLRGKTLASFAIGLLLLLIPLIRPVNHSDLTGARFLAALLSLAWLLLYLIAARLDSRRLGGLLGVLFAVGFVATPVMLEKESRGERVAEAEVEVMDALRADLRSEAGTTLLLTADSLSPKTLAYYFAYQYPESLTVRSFDVDVLKRDARKFQRTYFYIHRRRARRSPAVNRDKQRQEAMQRILRASSGDIQLAKKAGISLHRLAP